MIYLVTGVAGFIGSHLAKRLQSEGHTVIGVDNFSTGRHENLDEIINEKNFQFFERDITQDLSDVFRQKFDAVFHLAANPSVQESIENPDATYRVNVEGTRKVLLQCNASGVKRVVYVSTCAVYGDQLVLPITEDALPKPLSPYAEQKLMGEDLCRKYVDGPVILRLFNVFGPRQRPDSQYAGLIPKFCNLISRGIAPTINGDGNQSRDFVYVSDVVSALLFAAKTDNKAAIGQALNIGSGAERSVNEIAGTLSRIGRLKSPIIYGPALEEIRRSCASVDMAKAVLGWQCNREMFEEDLEETWKYYTNGCIANLQK